MSKFITGKELENAVYNIIWEAERSLLIVSPYIKLDDYFKRLFLKHLSNPKLEITLIFGKNEGHVNKSCTRTDFEFFQQFQNVSIIYVPNLHAKYYANENLGVVTSINLYDYSFKNNIEFGVKFERSLLDKIKNSTDDDVWENSMQMANENQVIFIKRPIYKKGMLFGKDYMTSNVLCDRTEELYANSTLSKGKLTFFEYPDELDFAEVNRIRPNREEVENTKPQSFYNRELPVEKEKDFEKNSSSKYDNNSRYSNNRYSNNHEKQQFYSKSSEAIPSSGFCIRSGTAISFNPDRPLSYPAYQSWNQFGNPDYPEKYCHFTGEPSNGQTCVNRPILSKNWKRAQKAHDL